MSLACPYPVGRIASGWKFEGERVVYEIEVPSNVEAEVLLPDGRSKVLAAGRHRIS